MGRQDAEAEAELQDIEAAYAAESARRRHLPDWSKTPAPRSRPPTAQPSPHGRVCLLAVVGALSPTCQGQLRTACVCLSDSYRRKDTFSFLLDGQQHNHNNRSISRDTIKMFATWTGIFPTKQVKEDMCKLFMDVQRMEFDREIRKIS
ncbi:uncharacterized protein [Triticum aestivum]|uniref:uncharacterized protein isoform X2 n=1 Tax=Triticum aestivum TaxID=4565 RepID=UPI001D030597|nr:uncharacterized protein LOC123112828 isoform X2 [Triticum aestivum]